MNDKENLMPRGIFIADKEYTFQASIQLLAHVFSSFVETLASAGYAGRIRLWDSKTGHTYNGDPDDLFTE
jgi:hypothetical protein